MLLFFLQTNYMPPFHHEEQSTTIFRRGVSAGEGGDIKQVPQKYNYTLPPTSINSTSSSSRTQRKLQLHRLSFLTIVRN
jgi:hypothetical protein